MKKLFRYPLLLLFAGFIIIVGILDLFASHRDFSEMENKKLAQKPPLTWASLISLEQNNKFSNLYEEYINDQFVGRDQWITMKSICESALGKLENNGVVYGKEDHLFDKYLTLDTWRMDKNIGYLSQFIEKYRDQFKITVMLVPNSYAVYEDLLPRGLHNVDQQEAIEKIYSQLPEGAEKLDLFPVMEAVRDRYIYYRTDHHWTTEGAYWVYNAYAQSKGKKAVSQEILEPFKILVDHFYGTYYNKCKLFSAKADEITYYDIPVKSVVIDGQEKNGLYDKEKWEAHDKYAGFLWSNNGVTVIKSDNNLNAQPGHTSRVLVLKDSYGNCFSPFLTYQYDEVYVVDPRYIAKLSELTEKVSFDDILVLYNFMSFASDIYIPRITY